MSVKTLDALILEQELLVDNKDFLGRLIKYLNEHIETDSPAILRKQISVAYEYMALLRKMRAKAEALYRLAQKNSAKGTNQKGDGRKAVIDGDTAIQRYTRDILQDYCDTLDSKLSASKAILSSLSTEIRSMPSE